MTEKILLLDELTLLCSVAIQPQPTLHRLFNQYCHYPNTATISSSPNSSSSRNSAASAASAPGQNSGSRGNNGNRSALQRRTIDPFVQRLQRIGEARKEDQRRLQEEQAQWEADQAAWDAEQAEWNAEHERRMAEAAREKAEAEEQALLDAQAKAQREQERDDRLNGLLAWMTDLQLETKSLRAETKSLRAKVERLEEELA